MTTTLAIGLIALIAWPSPSQEELRFQPQSGLILHKSFVLENETSLISLSVMTDNIPQQTQLGMELKTSQLIELTDVYTRLESEEPLELERTFNGVQNNLSAEISAPVLGLQILQIKAESPLAGKRVLHSRSSTDSAWQTQAAPESELQDSDILGLRYDLDFTGLLPRAAVALGESWSVPTTLINTIFAPAGNLRWDLQADANSDLALPLGARLPALGPLEGLVQATLMQVGDEEGARLATIELLIDVKCSQDLGAGLADLLRSSSGPGGIEMRSEVHSYELKYAFKGRATVIWDLGRGHLSSLQLSGKHTQTADSSMRVMVAGVEQLISNHMQLAGSTRASITFAP